MGIKNRLLVTAFMISFLALGSLQWAQAYTFYIDEFSVTRSGVLIFDNKFNDGSPPPLAPNWLIPTTYSAAAYFVNGTVGPEIPLSSPVKLTLDSSGAVPFTRPNGESFIHQQVILATPVLPDSDSGLKLKSQVTSSVTGVFNLIIPSLPREGYDVMFNDGIPGDPPDDVAMMRVVRTLTNDLKIQFARLNFDAGTDTVIDSVTLDTSHSTISLRLTKGDASDPSSNVVTGSYAYDNGSFTTFAGTTTIFSDPTENFTRAEFEAFAPAPVPEPGTMLLLGSGLLGLWGFRKKLKK